ncbi:MAG: hypothetical protein KBT68_05740 [bacterium]|nr:hypothetical protein [Candidatus Colisoma equi]
MLDVFTKVVLAGACLFTFAWVILAQRRTIKRLSDAYLRLTHFQRVLVALAVIVCTVYAQKPSTNDVNGVSGTNDVEIVIGGDTNDVEIVEGGTNGVDVVEGGDTNQVEIVGGGGDTNEVGGIVLNAPQPMSNGASFFGGCGGPGVSALPPVGIALRAIRNEIAFYELVNVTTNANYSYALPADGTIRGTWHLTGAYEDVQKVALDGFAFPLGSDLCTSLWAYTWGKVRPQLKNASNEIAAVGAPMSAIPDVSRFWAAATSNDTYLLTWENFVEGRQSLTTNDQQLTTLSAQLELRRNGDFITRSNDVEYVYRRVIEPNPIVDPINPPDPDDPTKPLYPYGPVQDLSVIEETNAYCWVDIVVDNADAWVRFEGDGASNLADPSFAAKAGETNHVVILIGKTYKVTCDMPFTVVGKSDPSIDEWWEDGNTLWLNWPVDIWARGDDEEPPLLLMSFGNGLGRGKDFTMFVIPSCLGGEFSWTNSCCAVYGSGTHFSYGCDEFCLCGGCSARGYYSYEGYRIGCDGNWCGCSWYDDDDRHGEDDPEDPEPTPGVSVSFSKSAVIFEDEYTNMPGQVVQWQSTTTKLTLEAHGGMKGGTATFTFTNKEKLIGPDIPTSITVPAGHCKTYEFTYRGNLPSGSEEDITVHGEFHENNPEAGSQPITSDAELTSVKVELTSVETAAANPDKRRHVYGVAEEVEYRSYPEGATVSWSFPNGLLYWNATSFCCPWSSASMSASGSEITVTFGDVSYGIGITVVDPVIQVQNPRVNVNSSDVTPVFGEAGHLVLYMDLYATPFYVSFCGLEIREVPDESQSCPHMGYYDDRSKGGNWSHTANDGAGEWHAVHSSGYVMSDKAGRGTSYQQPWSYGTKEWAIPMAWGNGVDVSVPFSPNPTTQLFTLQENGTFSIRKHGHEATRNTLGLIWCDGELCW